MGAVQNDDVIQALAPDGADHRFRERVRPGRSGGGEHLADPHVSDASREGLAVDRVSIPQEVWRAGLVRERLNDLANGPGRGGVFGHVDVEEFAAVMPQDDENEEQVGGDRGDKEEVDGDDVSGMRGEKGAPGGRRPRRRPVQVLGDGPLGDRVARASRARLTAGDRRRPQYVAFLRKNDLAAAPGARDAVSIHDESACLARRALMARGPTMLPPA
jgi:hypothetical protein